MTPRDLNSGILTRRTLLLAGISAAGASSAESHRAVRGKQGSDNSNDGDFVIHTNANLVVLDVAVEGPNGNTVGGLEKAHFSVFEDSRQQVIRHFSAEDSPVTAGLVLDTSFSMLYRMANLRKAVHAFLDVSNSKDEYFVAGFNDNPVFALPENAPFSNRPARILEAVDSLRPAGMTALYDGMAAALRHITGHSANERRVLVVISDGKDTASRTELPELIRLVRSTPVTIYTIGLFEGGDPDQNRGVLKQFARISGGRFYNPTTAEAVRTDCVRLAQDIRARYTLTYTPSENPNYGWTRRIRVNVSVPGEKQYHARTRTEIALEAPDTVPASRGRRK